jgi:hypothetical protein
LIILLLKDHHHPNQQNIENKSRIYVLIKDIIPKEIEQEILKRGYTPHIRHRREEENKLFHKKHPAARRWVVERTNLWHNNRFRKLFTRYEKKDKKNYLGLVELANSLIVYRRLILGYALSIGSN